MVVERERVSGKKTLELNKFYNFLNWAGDHTGAIKLVFFLSDNFKERYKIDFSLYKKNRLSFLEEESNSWIKF